MARTVFIALLSFLLTHVPAAAEHKHAMAGEISIEHAWARATPPTAKNGVAYVRVTNTGHHGDRLIGAAAAVAKRVELHTHETAGQVMKMRPIDGVDVPAGGTAELKPGGDHVMLMDLNAPLKDGESFPLTLKFEKAGEVVINVAISKKGPAMKKGAMGHNHGKTDPQGSHMGMTKATVHSISTDGIGAMIGTIMLKDTPQGLSVTADLKGLTPGLHAFHVHINPDCGPGMQEGEPVAGLAAGGHYHKPGHTMKGHARAPKKMAGDMPELRADAAGTTKGTITMAHLTVGEIKGRTIMVHAFGENETGKPKGGGARIACAVVPN